jgi:hypothetical protein
MIPWQQPDIIQHSQRLLNSYQHWTGRSLLDSINAPEDIAQALFEAPFVLVSHDTQADPIFNYGNQKALELWELDWNQFTQTPSRRTAEPVEWSDRDQLLEQAKTHGYIDNYQGIRISSTGRRFQIQDVLLWNVIDEQGNLCGQAATFSKWKRIFE